MIPSKTKGEWNIVSDSASERLVELPTNLELLQKFSDNPTHCTEYHIDIGLNLMERWDMKELLHEMYFHLHLIQIFYIE